METLEQMFIPLVAFGYFLCCQLVRRFLVRLLAPRLYLQLGLPGHANAVGFLLPRAAHDWLRQDFSLVRDWPWVLELAGLTTLLASVPILGVQSLRFENTPATLASMFLFVGLLSAFICETRPGSERFKLKYGQVFKGVMGAAVLILLLQAIFFSLGVQTLSEVTREVWLIRKSPLMFSVFLVGALLLPVFRFEIPEPGLGVGPASILSSLSECFWMSLLVTLFLSPGGAAAPFAAVDFAIKTGVMLFVMDFGYSFLPAERSFSVERKMLIGLIPLLFLFSVSLVWRRFIG